MDSRRDIICKYTRIFETAVAAGLGLMLISVAPVQAQQAGPATGVNVAPDQSDAADSSASASGSATALAKKTHEHR